MSAKTGAPRAASKKGGGSNTPEPKPPEDSGDEYGREGTNKTIPEPKADNAPSEELGNTHHVNKTPYVRG